MSALPELPEGWMWAEGAEGEILLTPCEEECAIEVDGNCPHGKVSRFRGW